MPTKGDRGPHTDDETYEKKWALKEAVFFLRDMFKSHRDEFRWETVVKRGAAENVTERTLRRARIDCRLEKIYRQGNCYWKRG